MNKNEVLEGSDNGYSWQSAFYESKQSLCKDISKRLNQQGLSSRDWQFFFDAIEEFHNTDYSNILKTKIGEIAGLASSF